MVTHTTSPRAAKDVPSYQGVEPEPVTKAPPWTHTMTGRLPSSATGVHTLRARQSSLMSGRVPPNIASRGDGFCGAMAAKAVASRTPAHGSGGAGGGEGPGPPGGPGGGEAPEA